MSMTMTLGQYADGKNHVSSGRYALEADQTYSYALSGRYALEAVQTYSCARSGLFHSRLVGCRT